MPLAFAMALDMPVADVLAAIGHDGSEIVFPSLPEPLCRRCFHIQELIQVALSPASPSRRWNCSPSYNPRKAGRSTRRCSTRTTTGDDSRPTIRARRGVIDGTGARFGHTVAYDHGRIYDPKGSVYDYSRLACEAQRFYARCTWRIDPIGERTCE